MTTPAPADREFFERSLADLDRELAAGDLTEADHRRLRADYERRLRGGGPPPRPPARPGLVAASVAFVLVVAVTAGVLVANSAGRRSADGSITGGQAVDATVPATEAASGPTTTLPDDLARCPTLSGSEAITCFTEYTDANPDDPDGFTQFGLFAINAGIQGNSPELLDAGEAFLARAIDLDPSALEPRVYRAVVLDRTGQVEEAAAACATFADETIPPDFQPLVDLACS